MNFSDAQFLLDTLEPRPVRNREPVQPFVEAAIDELLDDDDLVDGFSIDSSAVRAYVRSSLREAFAANYADAVTARALELQDEAAAVDANEAAAEARAERQARIGEAAYV